MANIKYPLYVFAFLIVQAFVCAGCGGEEEPDTPHDPDVVGWYYDIVLLNNDGTPRIIQEEEAVKLEVKWRNGTDYNWGCEVSNVRITDDNVIRANFLLVISPLFKYEEGHDTLTGINFIISLRSKSLFGTYDIRKITEYCKDIKTSEVKSWDSAFRTKSVESDDLDIVETSEDYNEKLDAVGSRRIVIRLKE